MTTIRSTPQAMRGEVAPCRSSGLGHRSSVPQGSERLQGRDRPVGPSLEPPATPAVPTPTLLHHGQDGACWPWADAMWCCNGDWHQNWRQGHCTPIRLPYCHTVLSLFSTIRHYVYRRYATSWICSCCLRFPGGCGRSQPAGWPRRRQPPRAAGGHRMCHLGSQ
jgi:hypothetical protein